MTKEEVTAKIKEYNQEIDRLIKERTALMDTSMPLFADAQIGERAYDPYTGRYLGVVSELYRFNMNSNPLYDTTMTIYYRFQDGDNTSRQGIYRVVNEAEYKRLQLAQAKRLVAQAKLTP